MNIRLQVSYVDILTEFETEPQIATRLTWEETCEIGKRAATALDEGRWIIGDLACDVEAVYGENRLNKFAEEIEVSFTAVKAWRAVSRFWSADVTKRDTYRQLPVLKYSHMRIATRLADVEAACSFLDQCAANNWRAAGARKAINELLGKPTPPKKLLDAVGEVVRVADVHGRAVVTLSLAPGVSMWDARKVDGARVRVVLSEDKES